MNEKLKVYDEKMTKSMHSLHSELAAIRAGRANPHVLDKILCRLLRNADSDPAGSERIGSGGAYDPDPAMGEEYAESA